MNILRTKARVKYFCRLSGDGAVELMDQDTTLPIYACNIKGKRTWYPETACVYYDKGQVIDVIVKFDEYACFVIGETQGTLDTEKWARLDQDSLAFRCNDDGEAITGLFKGE